MYDLLMLFATVGSLTCSLICAYISIRTYLDACTRRRKTIQETSGRNTASSGKNSQKK